MFKLNSKLIKNCDIVTHLSFYFRMYAKFDKFMCALWTGWEIKFIQRNYDTRFNWFGTKNQNWFTTKTLHTKSLHKYHKLSKDSKKDFNKSIIGNVFNDSNTNHNNFDTWFASGILIRITQLIFSFKLNNITCFVSSY